MKVREFHLLKDNLWNTIPYLICHVRMFNKEHYGGHWDGSVGKGACCANQVT